ncbi:MAG: hypothetical protein RR304_08615 [Bacteroides sp.]
MTDLLTEEEESPAESCSVFCRKLTSRTAVWLGRGKRRKECGATATAAVIVVVVVVFFYSFILFSSLLRRAHGETPIGSWFHGEPYGETFLDNSVFIFLQ